MINVCIYYKNYTLYNFTPGMNPHLPPSSSALGCRYLVPVSDYDYNFNLRGIITFGEALLLKIISFFLLKCRNI